MAITISTVTPTRRLTTKAAVKAELGISVTTDDALLDALIDSATAAIEGYTGWRYGFARQTYSETVKGYGGLELQLTQAPLISVTSVTDANLGVITDYSIGDRDESTLYRESGWAWTAQAAAGLTGRQRWPGWGNPQPQTEQPDYTVVYVAGYLLPSQTITGKTVSVSSTDNSFNDSASGFPALLKAGDVIECAGFANASANARHLVVSATAAKVVVGTTLTTETAPATDTAIKFRNRHDHLAFEGLEKAAIETVKSWYLTRKDDSSVIEKTVGPMSLRRNDLPEAPKMTLPPLASALVRPWIRSAL